MNQDLGSMTRFKDSNEKLKQAVSLFQEGSGCFVATQGLRINDFRGAGFIAQQIALVPNCHGFG